MNNFRYFVALILFAVSCVGQEPGNTTGDRASLERTTQAIRDAFARGDVAAVVALHHPDVVKYFGGANVVSGRAALETGLIQMFRNSKMEFLENRVESTMFNGETAIETSIFTIKVSGKDGDKSTLSRGRAMVVYVRYKGSPTGWASIREMAQAAPDEK